MPAELKLSKITTATAIALSQDSLEASSLLPDAKDPTTPVPLKLEGGRLRFTLPPHAVVFVTVQ